MKRSDIQYQDCIKILEEELLPAMGCTEPIAVAYCAAVARETLGEAPDRVVVEASGNIIKNVKSVIVPNTGQLRGIPAAAAAGIVVAAAIVVAQQDQHNDEQDPSAVAAERITETHGENPPFSGINNSLCAGGKVVTASRRRREGCQTRGACPFEDG